jgi:endonuclease III
MPPRESLASAKKRAARISTALAKLYPKARISLDFETPWQCLAATILSAQSTDAGVNRATPALFREYPDARAMAKADPKRVEQLIVTTGFFRQKTKSLIAAAQSIVEQHNGELPSEMEQLVKLRGVGRKTANVILGHVFGKPAFVVDTHVRRLTKRLGFTKKTAPDKIEIEMQKILLPEDWTPFSMRLILHGRQVCFARKPQCDVCAIASDCPKVGVKTAPHQQPNP